MHRVLPFHIHRISRLDIEIVRMKTTYILGINSGNTSNMKLIVKVRVKRILIDIRVQFRITNTFNTLY